MASGADDLWAAFAAGVLCAVGFTAGATWTAYLALSAMPLIVLVRGRSA